MKKICLFTAHPPKGGGGIVILHSLINNLPQLHIQWYYIAPEAIPGFEEGWIGSSFMGAGVLKDVFFSWTMLGDRKNPYISEITGKLLKIDCDAYWIVSHNEGLRVALELSRCQTQRPVHMTVHDDWGGALVQRSVRYRFFAGLSKKMTQKALDAVSSCDVISYGMKEYYSTLSNAEMNICHRYLTPESVTGADGLRNTSEIRVGHIGSVYDENDLFRFAYLLKEYAAKANKACSMHFWGFRQKKRFPKDLEDVLILHGDLAEPLAVAELKKCSLVYAMYPTSKKMRLFSKTSLPTKLTTYVQVGLPIFGHGPADSTLSHFLQDTGTGNNWTGDNIAEGIQVLDKVVRSSLQSEAFIEARERYFGTQNLNVVLAAFA